jgi:hypothetical protein
MILDDTSAALFTRMSAGTALTALLPGTASIYDTQAPDNATLPFVVFSHTDGGPENLDANNLEINLWYIRVYGSTSAKNTTEVFEQVDNLLNRVNITITGYNTLWCAREQNIKGIEITPDGSKIWNAGAIYRIRTA